MTLVTVLSASGRPGLAQVRQLLNAGYQVRATTRNPETMKHFENIEVVSADYNDPDSIYEACLGADTVFYTRPSFEESHKALDFAATVGSASKRAGVRRIIYNTCCWGPPDELGEVGQAGYDSVKLMVSMLMQAGVQTTTFQPVLFMDNLLTSWARQDIMKNDLYTYPHNPNLEASWICLDDVAKFMIAAINRDDLVGRCINIGGPEIFTPPRVADLLSGHFGRPIRYEELNLEDFSNRLYDIFYKDEDDGKRGGRSADREAFSDSMSDFYRFNNISEHKPFKVDMAPVLKEIPIKLTPFSEWMKQQDWHEELDTTAG